MYISTSTGYLVLQGNIPLRTAPFKQFLKLLARMARQTLDVGSTHGRADHVLKHVANNGSEILTE